MKPCRVAKKVPAKPPNMAPVAKAVSLAMVVLMPSERQAISSSRIASQARPIGSRRRRKVTRLVMQRKPEDHVIEEDDGVERIVAQAEEACEGLASVGREGQAEEGRLRDVGDAVRPVGHVRPVEQHDADDLAEGERHDGEIVAAKPKHREAEDDAPQRGEQRRRAAGRSRSRSRNARRAARRCRRRPHRRRHSRGRAGRRARPRC